MDIQKINKIAFENDCFCISTEYIQSHNKLEWTCKKGHIWERSWSVTNNKNRWCCQCKIQDEKIKKLEEIVDEKSGIMIPNNYINTGTKIFLMCENNHIWKATPFSIINTWCTECNHATREKNRLDAAHQIAEQHHGFCLSKTCEHGSEKLSWKCSNGHTWNATFNSVVRGVKSWCPKCNINVGEEITRRMFNIMFNEQFEKIRPEWLNRLEIDGYCEKLALGFEYDGQQHYEYIRHFHRTIDGFKTQQKNDKIKNELCDDQGITLIRIPYWIKFEDIQHFIIKECKKNKIEPPNKELLDYKQFNDIYKNNGKYALLKKMVEDKKGILFTDVYINKTSKFQVECEFGHIWDATYGAIKNGTWCSTCSGNKKMTIDEMRAIAIEKNGKCLSEEYINNATKLKWQCEAGHVWESAYCNISGGHWCPSCSNNKKHTIEKMHELAHEKNGKCLSKKYINNSTKLKWQCDKNHIWEQTAGKIIAGRWCSICLKEQSKKNKSA